jgi:mannose-6-phosphate isomerase-like protein (cupin superfamily)
MHVVTAQSAPKFDLFGVQFTGYAAPSRGSHQVCAWHIQVPVGHDSGEPHVLDRDEVFMVTAGRIRLADGGPELASGDCAIVPAGTGIRLINSGDTVACAHVIVPAGFSATMADGQPLGTPPWAQ